MWTALGDHNDATSFASRRLKAAAKLLAKSSSELFKSASKLAESDSAGLECFASFVSLADLASALVCLAEVLAGGGAQPIVKLDNKITVQQIRLNMLKLLFLQRWGHHRCRSYRSRVDRRWGCPQLRLRHRYRPCRHCRLSLCR